MSIRCHHCNSENTKVKDSRPMVYGFTNAIRRRLECLDCGKKFSSVETSNLHNHQDDAVRLTGAISRLNNIDLQILRTLLARFLKCGVNNL